MAQCWQCGTETAETWRFCSVKGAFVCINCERSCPDHTAQMLPSGINCMKLHARLDRRSQALNRVFVASPAEIEKAKKRYEKNSDKDLWANYGDLLNRYDLETDDRARADKRTSLAAIRALIIERGGVNCGR